MNVPSSLPPRVYPWRGGQIAINQQDTALQARPVLVKVVPEVRCIGSRYQKLKDIMKSNYESPAAVQMPLMADADLLQASAGVDLTGSIDDFEWVLTNEGNDD